MAYPYPGLQRSSHAQRGRVDNPLTHRLVQLRNAESLRRLARLAERP